MRGTGETLGYNLCEPESDPTRDLGYRGSAGDGATDGGSFDSHSLALHGR